MTLMMKSIIMGIVEGLTEFLPISSTGHLIITGELIGFNTERFATLFEIVIQLGAILAVIFYYRARIIESLKNLRPGQRGFNLWFKMFVAVLPSTVVGVIFNDYIETFLFSSYTVAIALVIGGFLIILVENAFGRAGLDDMEKADLKQAFIIGLAQCLALFPGMSRSASTIMGGMISGLSIKAAAEFSFFLAIPTMIGAAAYSMAKGSMQLSAAEWQALGIGFFVSFLVALLAVDKFLSYLGKHSLKAFAYYRIVFGGLMLALINFGIVK
jgi:undecaprenyl-diphosphatase